MARAAAARLGPERVVLSIIMPMLNEAAELPGLLAHLAHWRTRGCEVVLVDGGSTDGSAAMARAAGFTVVDAERGRARQMNAGAAAAGGAVLPTTAGAVEAACCACSGCGNRLELSTKPTEDTTAPTIKVRRITLF